MRMSTGWARGLGLMPLLVVNCDCSTYGLGKPGHGGDTSSSEADASGKAAGTSSSDDEGTGGLSTGEASTTLSSGSEESSGVKDLGGPSSSACGDGLLDVSEECDDGQVDTATCDPDCTIPLCGDGYINSAAGETCELGEPGCREDCTRCGDGIVNSSEQCDSLDAGCTPDCKIACGDGVVDKAEECDLGPVNGPAPAFCDVYCKRRGLIVFVTEDEFLGDLNGADGANQICSEAGLFLNPVGTLFSAWISVEPPYPYAPNEAFNHCGRPYYLPNGTLIAENFGSLSTSSTAIDITERRNKVLSGPVWTNTDIFGSVDGASSCNRWTAQTSIHSGSIGRVSGAGNEWTDYKPISCDKAARLYCFEQAPWPCL